MLSVESLKVEFAARPLFSDVSFVVNPRDRIALVGKNGAGKSTLLKIIAGLQTPSGGALALKSGVSVGYLPQVMNLADGHTVIEETEQAFAYIRQHREQLECEAAELAERTDYESAEYMELVETYTMRQERFQMMGGLNYRAEMERTLIGLGFSHEDFDRPTNEFSGGWRMRIELAKILLSQPDLLLLDEPTNHLDIESIRWLERFLAHAAGAVILVSHDRAFINNVTSRTIELTCGTAYDYRVRYDEYVKLRAERREQQLRAYENQQKEMADLRDFIERFRYKPTKSAQVQSRIKQLEKIVPVEVDGIDNSVLHLKFPPCQRSGNYPVMCDGVSKSYGHHQVFSQVTLTIARGEKVAFVGRNGEGKSTLVKCIMGETSFEGTLKVGHNVQIGYYAQNQAQLLDEQLTVFDTIDCVATGEVRLKIRDILGAFMFGGEDSDKRVKVLSGGERSRLAMIRLLLEPVNFLILDEPTNHLDMRTKDVLKEAIRAFDGTVVLVSHDRDFLDGLVTKVYEFGGGQVREYLGGIYDFLQKKDMEGFDELSTSSKSSSTQSPHSAVGDTSEGKQAYLYQKEQQRERRKKGKAVEAAEAVVAALDIELKKLEAGFSEGKMEETLFVRHAELKKEIEKAEARWLELAAELE